MRRRSRSRRSPSRSTMQIVAPRGLSTRPTPIVAAQAAAALPPPGATGPGEERVEQVEGLAGARVRAVRAVPGRRRRRAGEDGLEARRRRGGWLAVRASSASPPPGRPARRRRARARPPRSTMPTSGSRSWKEALKRSSRQARARLGADRGELSRAAPTVASRRAQVAAAHADGAEEEAVAGQGRVQPAGALGEGGEAVVAGGEADAGADGGDVVEVAPDAFELEQDRARRGRARGRPRARARPRRRAHRRRALVTAQAAQARAT